MNSLRSSGLVGLIVLLSMACSRDFPATVPYTPPTNPTAPGTGTNIPPQEQPAPQKRLFLANDKVKVAIDLSMGGAINYLSEANSNENMVNNTDLGRQLQTSIYAGPYPYSVNGKDPVFQWRNLGWNPVQSGDVFNHSARVVSYQQEKTKLYVKTIPLIWPLFDEPADCTMEHWLEIKDNTVHVRCRIVVNRADTTQYEARTQETPCVYLNGPYYRMVTYTGNQPFTNGAVSEYKDRDMVTRYASENWIALLNEGGRGVGLFRSNEYRYRTAGFGTTLVGGEFDMPSGYMNSDSFLVIDHNGTYEYEYTLVVGALTDIRQFAYNQPRPSSTPNYQFSQNRLGWYYYNTRDLGWPIQNELAVKWERFDKTQSLFRIMSPMAYWRTADAPKLYVHAAFKTGATAARLVWRKPEDPDFVDAPERLVEFPIIGDGQYRVYEINMSGRSGWDGVINQLCLTPAANQQGAEVGSIVRLRSLTATRPN
jgi:hypothetical protein